MNIIVCQIASSTRKNVHSDAVIGYYAGQSPGGFSFGRVD
jgi:hypothetical protein